MRDFKITAEPSGTLKIHRKPPRYPSSSRSTPPRISTTTSASAGTASSKAGPSPRAPATSSTTSASPSRSKTTPWNTAASKASSPKASTAAAPSWSGTRAHGSRNPAYPDVDEGLRTARSSSSCTAPSMQGKMGPHPHEAASPANGAANPTGSSSKSTTTSSAPKPTPPSPKRTPTASSPAAPWSRSPPAKTTSGTPKTPPAPAKPGTATTEQNDEQPPTRSPTPIRRRQKLKSAPTAPRNSAKTPKEPSRLHPPAARPASHHPTRHRRLAPRAQARRLPHPGPQIRPAGPTPHPHRPRLDAPHEDRRRRQVATLPAESAILDGEVVVLDDRRQHQLRRPPGRLSGRRAQSPSPTSSSISSTSTATTSATSRSSSAKQLLAALLANAHDAHPPQRTHRIQRPRHLPRAPASSTPKASSPSAPPRAYLSGRTADWLKSKCLREQEFVIGGFTLPAKGHAGIHGVGALLLGYYRDGKLIYAGRTGTGFTQKTHAIIRTQLDKLRQTENPFYKPPDEARRGVISVKPKLVAQVRFATWTADNLVRQAAFHGLREDKPATEVRREQPLPLAETQQKPTTPRHPP